LAESEWEKPQDEPLFMMLEHGAPEVVRAAKAARASLPLFRLLLPLCEAEEAYPLVRIFYDDGQCGLWLWLVVVKVEKEGFVAETFETPPSLPDLQPGTRLALKDSQIVDWMLNHAGTLYGGYSIRLQRSRLPRADQEKYDRYVGVTRYAPLPDE